MDQIAERRHTILLASILGVAAALRIWLLEAYTYSNAHGDERLHYITGVVVSRFGTEPMGIWAPGYEFLLGVIFRIFGPDPYAAHVGQIILSVGSVFLIYRMARHIGGNRAGLFASAIAATDPTLVAYSHYFFSEVLYTFLLLLGANVYFAGPRSPSARNIGAGLAFGCAVLTRSLALYFFPLWIAYHLLTKRRDRARSVALVFAVSLMVVSPWSVRNWLKYGGFLLVDGTLGRTAYEAYSRFTVPLGDRDLHSAPKHPDHHRVRPPCEPRFVPETRPLPPVEELRRLFPGNARGIMSTRDWDRELEALRHHASLDLVHRQRCETRAALEFAINHPAVVYRNTLQRLFSFWGPNSFLLRSIWREDYGARGVLKASSYPAFKIVVVGLHVFIGVAALLGWCCHGRRAALPWLFGFACYCTAIHAVSVSHSRYRFAVTPFVMIAAATWLANPAFPRSGRGRLAAAGASVGFVVYCAVYTRLVLP